MATSAEQRQLLIKLGTLKRLRKELAMYKEEEKTESSKVHKLKEANADPHDIKYAENILAESRSMIPDTEQRLRVAMNDLSEFLESNKRSLEGSTDVVLAKEELAQSSGQLG